MTFRPLNDRILVKRENAAETTKGGIIVPDSAQEKPARGTVVATGTGKTTSKGTVRPLEVKTNQTVFFRSYAGTEINVNGEEHLLLREDEILAVAE